VSSVEPLAAPTPTLDVRRILIIRTSAIGDIVFASPMAAALRRTYPHAHIAWLVESGLEQLIANDPAIDQILSWPRAQWSALRRARRYADLLGGIKAFRNILRANRFDVALDLQGLLKSALLARLSGAPKRIGLGSREGSAMLMTRVIERGGPVERISSEYLHFAQQLGLDADEFMPRLFSGEPFEQRAAALLRAQGIESNGYAVFAPFTTRPQKHWFADSWQELAGSISARLGLAPVVLGGSGDREAAKRLVNGAVEAVDLAGQTSLGEAAAIIRGAALIVGVDTGLTHMGIGFDRPTVALFGSTRPYLAGLPRNAEVIWLGMNCSPCRRHPTCNGAFTCLRDIRPERVMASIERVLRTATSTG
jgi:heptosyltransferase-1